MTQWGQWRDSCDRVTKRGLAMSLHHCRLACTCLWLASPDVGLCPWWVHNDNACVCPLTGCKSRCHPHSGLRRKQGRYLGPHLQKHRRNEESPLHDRCAGRSWAFCAGRDPRTLRDACCHPQRTLFPRSPDSPPNILSLSVQDAG